MREMSRPDIDRFLRGARLGHLGLAQAGNAYVIPVFYAYDGQAFYFQTLPGLKDDYLRGTHEACFVVTDASTDDRWVSVQVTGSLNEVRDVPDQLRAMQGLLGVPVPPVHGENQLGHPRRSALGLHHLKLTPSRMTGRQSDPPLAPRADAGVTGM